MTAADTTREIQRLLGTEPDGDIGPRSRARFEQLAATDGAAAWPPVADLHIGKASSFADAADIRRFERCKTNGGTDQECFAVGDNGVGKWGDSCAAGSGPRCALPPEDWAQWGDAARGKEIVVTANGKSVVCELRDTMPHRRHITNGAIIDLNEDAGAALGLRPPFLVAATWRVA